MKQILNRVHKGRKRFKVGATTRRGIPDFKSTTTRGVTDKQKLYILEKKRIFDLSK